MGTVLQHFSSQFDFILLDLPPVNAVTDGLVLSKLVDGMIFVVVPRLLREEAAGSGAAGT